MFLIITVMKEFLLEFTAAETNFFWKYPFSSFFNYLYLKIVLKIRLTRISSVTFFTEIHYNY